MYCSRQIVSWTADSSNKSDILPSVTLGTRHHVCVQLSRKYRRCIRTSGVSRISRSSNQPHAIWQLTRGQNPRAAARCRHKHNYPLGLTPLTPLLAANLAISPLSAVVWGNQQQPATGGVLAAGKSSWEECWSVGGGWDTETCVSTLSHIPSLGGPKWSG